MTKVQNENRKLINAIQRLKNQRDKKIARLEGEIASMQVDQSDIVSDQVVPEFERKRDEFDIPESEFGADEDPMDFTVPTHSFSSSFQSSGIQNASEVNIVGSSHDLALTEDKTPTQEYDFSSEQSNFHANLTSDNTIMNLEEVDSSPIQESQTELKEQV